MSADDRRVVWSQPVNSQYGHASSGNAGLPFSVPAPNPGFNDTSSATDGAWIVVADTGSTGNETKLYNVDTQAFVASDQKISGRLTTHLSCALRGGESLNFYSHGSTFTVADNAGLQDLSVSPVTYIQGGNAGFGSSRSLAPPSTPLPATLPLYVTGLAGLGLFGWYRKRAARAVSA